MSAERIISDFRDISMTFQINPVNNDLIALKNENAIARALRNLVLTNLGERPFQNDLGSRVSRLLFDNIDEFVASSLESEIKSVIQRFEPRVKLIKVSSNKLIYRLTKLQFHCFYLKMLFSVHFL